MRVFLFSRKFLGDGSPIGKFQGALNEKIFMPKTGKVEFTSTVKLVYDKK